MIVSGRVTCDGCGGELTNGGVIECAIVTVLSADRVPVMLHYCLADVRPLRRCAVKLLDNPRPGAPVPVYNPAPPPPPEPEPADE